MKGTAFPHESSRNSAALELSEKHDAGSHFSSLLQGPLLPQPGPATSEFSQSLPTKPLSLFPGVVGRYTLDQPPPEEWAPGGSAVPAETI